VADWLRTNTPAASRTSWRSQTYISSRRFERNALQALEMARTEGTMPRRESLPGLRRPSPCLIPTPCRQPAHAEGGRVGRTSTGDSDSAPPSCSSEHCQEMFTCLCSVFAQGAKTRRFYIIVFTKIERPLSSGKNTNRPITQRFYIISAKSGDIFIFRLAHRFPGVRGWPASESCGRWPPASRTIALRT